MKRNCTSESGWSYSRIVVALSLCLVGGWMAMLSFASTPSSGTLSDTTPVLTYTAGPFLQANPSPLGLGQLDTGPRCNAQFPCDHYLLTVQVPPGYVAANPNASVRVALSWTDTGTGNSDYDLYVYNGNVPTLAGNQPASYQGPGQDNPEVASIFPISDGTSTYSIKIVPYTPTGETVSVRIELLAGAAGGPIGFPGFGNPDPTVPGKPRYQNYYPPKGSSAEPGSGEFNIGFNPATGRFMLNNIGPVWRVTPPELLNPALPECCEGLWEDKSSLVADTGLDPILWTDQPTGRTFASNATAGANAAYAYTDNDGDLWQGLAGVAPPNAGDDHQTIGSGPYPDGVVNPLPAVNQGQVIYYCSQTFPVGAAGCQRSDTLGTSYGPGVLVYDGSPGCRALHGHVRTAPDGTVYLPVPDCTSGVTSQNGFVRSTDAGITWQEKYIPNSEGSSRGSDSAMAVDAAGKVYYFYILETASGNQGHMFAQVSTDRGDTWTNPVDLGASHGVVNVAFPEGIAGDSGRAAVGFLGTDQPGNFQSITFPGIWYAFIATTFDGGQTWTTTNVSPNDPVQGLGGIWQGGGGNQNRNLLDFNEITIDDKGRPVFGYSDGCVGECVGNPTDNSFTAHMRMARQSGGRTLFASQDGFNDGPNAPIAPKAACLSGTRDPLASHLEWKVPDNGGADIAKYQIFRGTAAGGETFLFETATALPKFDDTSADPLVPEYYYFVKAVNSVGVGVQSNEIKLLVITPPIPENLCLRPGLTELTDAEGDGAGPGTDLKSFQLSQPFAIDGVPKLVFTINTDPGIPVQPLNSHWYVSMKFIDGANVTYKAVHMIWKSATPTFESYTPGASSGGTVDGRFVEAGSELPAEASSSYDPTNGKVVIVVKASDLGLTNGSTIAGFVSGVAQGVVAGAALYDQMPNSLAYTGTYTLASATACSPILSVVSRKSHAGVNFDVNLPLVGDPGTEPRLAGPNDSFTLIFTFDAPVTSAGSASLSEGSGTPSTAMGPDSNQITVNLTGVTDAQRIGISLNNVQRTDGTLNNLSAHMDVLAGDTDGDARVNITDTNQTKSRSGQTTGASNFRTDVNLDGRVNVADANFVKSHSGNAIGAAGRQRTQRSR